MLERQAQVEEPDLGLLQPLLTSVYVLLSEAGPWTERLTELDPLPEVRALGLRCGNPKLFAHVDAVNAAGLLDLGRLDESKMVLESGIASYAESPWAQANLLVLQADLFRKLEHWKEARSALDDTDRLVRAAESRDTSFLWLDLRCAMLGVLGMLELDLGRLDLAWRAFRDQRDVVELYQANPGAWRDRSRDAGFIALLRRAELLLITDRHAELFRELEPALKDPAATAWVPSMRVLEGITLARLEIDDPDREPRARSVLEAVVKDPALDDVQRGAAELRLARLDLHQDRLEDVPEILESCRRRLAPTSGSGDAAIVYQVAYLSVLESWLARASGADRKELEARLSALEEAIDLQLDSWEGTDILPGGVGFLRLSSRSEMLGEHIELCLALGELERAWHLLVLAQKRGTLARRLEVEVPDFDQVQQSLVEGGGILMYVPTLLGSHLLYLDEEGVGHERLPELGRLRSLSRELEEALRSRREAADDDAIARSAEGLGKALLPASIHERIAGWDHVYVVGADLVGGPRFEAFLFGETTLGREKALAYLPSVPLGVFLAERTDPPRPPSDGDLFLVAGPPPGGAALARWSKLSDLALDEEELEQLVAGFPGDLATVLPGPTATPAALLGEDLEAARILHFFGHGAFDGARPLPAGLVLAGTDEEPGVLWCADIEGLRVPEIVVLSACGAARGLQRIGEDGVVHLGGAFFFAGASTVVLSDADLRVGATLRLMELFQTELAGGASVAEALRAARVAMAKEEWPPFHGDSVFALGPAHRPPFR